MDFPPEAFQSLMTGMVMLLDQLKCSPQPNSQGVVQAAEHLIKRHEAFITTMDANDEKINAVLQFAQRLMEESHYAADKIQKKAEAINERSVC